MYQGYQLVLTGRPRAVRERLVEVSGTTVSVSPLQTKKQRNMNAFSCTRESLKKLKTNYVYKVYTARKLILFT